jgi:hypothetical protein
MNACDQNRLKQLIGLFKNEVWREQNADLCKWPDAMGEKLLINDT